ncbi:hypothetical protein OG896_37310 [Streptomyces sp. NBC_00669]|uniref:hypothetical protein n=1 Tax=unclassified Streptomyces TaxID=2593676 RepID=UPI002E323051|nr:hypothetical protein [Streptomyces sp. NBC_00669]
MSDASVCWNCRARPAHPLAAHRVRLSRDVRRSWVVVGHHYEWRSREVSVPRCPRCRRINLAYATYHSVLRIGGGFVGFLAAAGAIAALVVHHYSALVVAGFMAAALLVVLVPARLIMWRHPRKEPTEYPPVAELIAAGWHIGNPY